MRSGARLFYCLSLFLLLVLVLVLLLLAVGGVGGGVWTRQYTLYPFRCARGVPLLLLPEIRLKALFGPNDALSAAQ